MNSRRLMGFPRQRISHPSTFAGRCGVVRYSKINTSDVRFGSKADITALVINVCFAPKSGHRNWPASPSMTAAPDGLSSAIGVPVMSDPTRYTLDGLCAVTASGQTAAALPRSMINSRRLMASPAPRTTSGIKSSITFWVEKAVRYTNGPPSCPLWVKRRHHRRADLCLLYSRKRTSPSRRRNIFNQGNTETM